MRSSPFENSVRNLQNLYTVVAGLALTLAVDKVIDTRPDPLVVHLDALPLLWAFLVTLVPFYHGALRHLDVAYVETNAPGIRSGALMADFVLLFVEGCWFLALASFLRTPLLFVWALAALLVFDAIWAFFAHLAFTHETPKKAELMWAKINFPLALASIAFLAGTERWPTTQAQAGAALLVLIVVVATGRTVFDYALSWDFYMPPRTTVVTDERPRGGSD